MIMKCIAIALAIVALGCSLIAAYYWFKSAGVEFPPLLTTAMGDFDPKMKAANAKTAKLNRKAAIWTGIASVLGTLAGVISTLS